MCTNPTLVSVVLKHWPEAAWLWHHSDACVKLTKGQLSGYGRVLVVTLITLIGTAILHYMELSNYIPSCWVPKRDFS